MAKASSLRIVQLARTRIDVDCYIRWLRLRSDPEYLRESEKIRQLKDAMCKAIESAKEAYAIYKSLLKRPDLPSNKAKEIAETECQRAEQFARSAERAFVGQQAKLCKRFGISQWWPPEDNGLGMENARYIFEPSSPIQVIPPPPEMQIDLNAEGIQRMRQELLRTGRAIEPPQKYTMADKDGWLTIRINLNIGLPLEELALVIRDLLRQHQYCQPNGRKRPDKDAEALEAFVCYEEQKKFSLVAQRLRRKVATVKGQYVRAHTLIKGRKPSGTMKQRRAGIIDDPAVWFQTHFGSCSRCQKADTTEGMCAAAFAQVTQDEKALRERLESK